MPLLSGNEPILGLNKILMENPSIQIEEEGVKEAFS